MVNINDFKLLCQKSKKYFDLLTTELNVNLDKCDLKLKERIGFYLYMLENICGVKEITDLAEMVTDTEFNSLLFNEKYDDYGIDAININTEDLTINLFNFKYRETFNKDKEQSINDTIISTKFVNALARDNISGLKGKIKTNAKQILKCLTESNDIWKFNLYVVSNEYIELNSSDDNLDALKDIYGLEIISIGLPQISKMMSLRPHPINAELIVDNDAIMSFQESQISSSKSYIIRLPISEIIRITCDDKNLRNKYNIEDLKPLSSANLDSSILFDNVRGLVLKSKYNTNISETLKKEPEKFFMYNNGLTMAAKDIIAEPINANKRIKLTIKGFQVLNGGQTLRTIHKFNQNDKENIIEYLSSSVVLVRIFKAKFNDTLTNKIAEYTNSQNSISNVDLKSLRSEQIQLEQYLDEYNIIYSRKTGDTGLTTDKIYDHKISMERYGQVLFSIKGYPEKATNQKKQIFDKYYPLVFGEESLVIADSPKNIERYFEIKNKYEKSQYNSTDQKVFYILYLDKQIKETIPQQISLLEEKVKKYKKKFEIDSSEARILIQKRFKLFLDEELSINQDV